MRSVRRIRPPVGPSSPVGSGRKKTRQVLDRQLFQNRRGNSGVGSAGSEVDHR